MGQVGTLKMLKEEHFLNDFLNRIIREKEKSVLFLICLIVCQLKLFD